MIRYINEYDEIEMDVQVGPRGEREVSVDPEEAVPMSPVDLAKADPKNVPIACKKDCEGCYEFFVDARDLEKYADLTEQTMLGALNSLISENAYTEIGANNITVVLGESTVNYARNLEKHGAAYVICREADGDIEIGVQVGPNGEDMQVQADPQEANPVDAVKREYDNVVVAKQGDEFFVDVEDVQKCAELNCESVISCLNNVIEVNEASGISADNLVVLVHEGVTSDEVVNVLEQAGAEIGVVREDNSDVKSHYAQKAALDKVRSEKGLPKRPKITKNMSEKEKDDLRYYDHGSTLENRSNVISARHASSKRDDFKQKAEDFHGNNRANERDADYYNKGNKFYGLAYQGTGSSKKKA